LDTLVTSRSLWACWTWWTRNQFNKGSDRKFVFMMLFEMDFWRELRLMKPTAILINTSRGPVVDEKALLSALKQKKIAAAGLDVYEKEPRLTPGLSRLENVVLLPHIGSATNDTRGQMAVVAARNAIAMVRGRRPKNIVNPQVFESSEYLRRIGK
jgi:phosphoglycerate dehydrogenase-like enzyme